MTKKKEISKSDISEWEQYIKNPNDVFDKDRKINHSNLKLRFKFDLHGYSLKAANEKVKEIINSCYEHHYKEILLITGKGIHSNTEKDLFVSRELSKLRYSIPDYIKTSIELSDKVNEINVAGPKDGGDWAIIIKLRTIK